MSISTERIQKYEEAKVNRDSGNLNGLPLYYTFPKLSSIIPSIPRAFQILWTANSGIGKTQSWIAIIIYTVYYVKKYHPELNLNIKLVIALLEDTKAMFVDRLVSMMLYYNYGIVVDSMELQSLGENSLSEDVLSKIKQVQVEVDLILEDCEIIDSVYNPTGTIFVV